MRYSLAQYFERSASGLVLILMGVILALADHYYRGYLNMSQGTLDLFGIFANSSTWFTMGVTMIIVQFVYVDKKKKAASLSSASIPQTEVSTLTEVSPPIAKKPNTKLPMIVVGLILLGTFTILILDARAPTWKTYSKYQVSMDYYHSMVLKETSINDHLFSSEYGQINLTNSSVSMGVVWSKNLSFDSGRALDNLAQGYRSQFDTVEVTNSYNRVVSGFQASCQEYLITKNGVKIKVEAVGWYDVNNQMAYLFIGSRPSDQSDDNFSHSIDSLKISPMQVS